MPLSKMKIRFAPLGYRSVLWTIWILCLQVAIFFGGMFLLSTLYHPEIPEHLLVPKDWEISHDLYPYAFFESIIFVISTMIAFSLSPWSLKTVIFLVAGEIATLFFLQLLSSAWEYDCEMLISLSHHAALSKPNCGISSLNILSLWFGMFLIATILLWHWILSKRSE